MSKLKVYLAGPDVFRADPKAHFDNIKSLGLKYNLECLSPLDNECSNSLEIYRTNLDLVYECDVVVANITPFRGPSVDPGTAFEIGYAKALGKKVVMYSEDLSQYKCRVEDSAYSDFPGVENFGLVDNLMIAHSGGIYEDIDECFFFIWLHNGKAE